MNRSDVSRSLHDWCSDEYTKQILTTVNDALTKMSVDPVIFRSADEFGRHMVELVDICTISVYKKINDIVADLILDSDDRSITLVVNAVYSAHIMELNDGHLRVFTIASTAMAGGHLVAFLEVQKMRLLRNTVGFIDEMKLILGTYGLIKEKL